MDEYRRQAFAQDFIVRREPGQASFSEAELHITRWLSLLDRGSLDLALPHKSLSVVLEDSAHTSETVLQLIAECLGPRMTELRLSGVKSSWKTIKTLLGRTSALRSVSFRDCPWLSDAVLEHLSKRFSSSLVRIELENTSLVTNSGLFQLGRRCKGLTSLSIVCCPRLSDVGLSEISKNNKLSFIRLAHSESFTDKGLEALLLGSKKLFYLELTNCSKISNNTLSYLYEMKTNSGVRKTQAAAYLRSLILSDNQRFSQDGFLWISAGAPNIQELRIVECPSINISQSLTELVNFRSISTLTVGRVASDCNPALFVKAVCALRESLRFIRIEGLSNLLDQNIAEIAERCDGLSALQLIDVAFGRATVEALCSYNPRIETLELTGSALLSDKDLRGLCTICLDLLELRVGDCGGLSDAAFSRLMSLRKLRSVHIDGGTSRCSAVAVKFLPLCPLTELSLSRLSFKSLDSLECLKSSTRQQLERLNITHCESLSISLVQNSLAQFVGCREINLTQSVDHMVEQLSSLDHTNPCLSWKFHHEFAGYALQGSDEDRFVRFWAVRRVIRRHYGARLFQRLWRKYLRQRLLWREMRREQWNDFKLFKIVQIQSLIRCYIARQRKKKIKRCFQLVGRVVITFVTRRRKIKLLRARRFHDCSLYRRCFSAFQHHTAYSHDLLSRSAAAAEIVTHRNLKHRLMNMMKEANMASKSRTLQDSACIMWEINILRAIFRCWRTVLGETSTRKQLLCKVFMLVASEKALNSRRQQRLVRLADDFRSRRLMMLAWITIARDRLDSRRVDLMTPLALEHFRKKFFERVVGKCFRNISLFKMLILRKVENNSRADNLSQRLKRLRVFWFLRLFHERKLSQKKILLSATVHWKNIRHRNTLFIGFPEYRRLRRKQKQRMHKAARHFLVVQREKGFYEFLTRVIEHRRWRELNANARFQFNRTIMRKTFKGWDVFRHFNERMDVYYFERYQKKLMKKVLQGLKTNVAMNQEAVRAVTNSLIERAGDDTTFCIAIDKIVLFQARCRGVLAQRKFHEERIQKLYSIQVLQNFFRTLLARKEYMSRYKKRDIAEKVMEDTELDLMREAELETRFFLYQERAIVDIQRVFRGWLGRKLFAQLAIEYFRNVSKDYYLENQHLRVHHEAYKRAMIAREQLKHRAAIEIQRIVRGYFGRRKYRHVYHHAKMAKYAVHLQRAYHKRLAKLSLEALRRDKLSDMRYKAARKQRGWLLRLLGFRNRGQQYGLAPALESAGLDPISFNYRFTELITETINDFYHTVNIFKRERGLFKEHGFNKLNLSMARRQIFVDQGWKFNLHDTVRIIEPGHPFEGYTGVVVRIDESLAGLPLFEVKLDRFPRQTFLRMTTDPVNIYAKAQALAKILKRPDIVENDERAFRIFPSGLDRPIDKKAIYAAWTIQRAYRVHRARKIAARKRYEFWMRCIARQWCLLYQFADHNSLNAQGYNAAFFMGTRSINTVRFEEIRHKILPGRLTNVVSKPSESRVINREFDWRYKDRIKFLQKCNLIPGKEPFSLGFERLNSQRKFMLFLHKSLGVVAAAGFSLKNMFGTKGIRTLANRKSTMSGTDKFCFKQFQHSNHVRHYKTSMYQGEWSGIPLFTPMKPHGEGFLVFLDAWGFAKEDKVLYLTILRCRHLNVMDVTTSDPFCDIFCNGTNVQTTVKWRNLNPQFHESFEIDVTNPLATLNIQVKDKDYFGSDDFMGQIVLNLGDFSDGLEHQVTHQLKGEDVTVADDFDRGEIELRLRWAERVFEDEQARLEIKRKMAVRIQSWARRIASLIRLNALRKERIENLAIVKRNAIKITSVCRVRLAKKEFKRRMRKHKAAIKIQKRVRIWIAKRVVSEKKLHKNMAVRIQTLMRIFLAKKLVRSMKEKMASDLFSTVSTIQKYVRRWLAMRWLEKQRLSLAMLDKAPSEPVSVWIAHYGVDPEYGLKRNRRITERLFSKMLKTRFVRILSRFGVVFIDSYPPRKTEEEMMQEFQKGNVESLTVRDDFVAVFLPTFDPVLVHRSEAISQFQRFNHTAVLNLKSSVDTNRSVHALITVVQCAQRQRMAKTELSKLLRAHKGIALFQKIFRRRYEKQHKAAVKIASLLHMVKSRRRTSTLRREKRAAIILQCSYRCYRARSAMFDIRSVDKLAVLRATPSLPMNEAEKCLEHRSDTFWVAESPDKAEIRVEFAKWENIVELWIMTSTFSASPSSVSISYVRDKSVGYEELVERTELPLLVGDRWHRFPIPVVSAKYFMFVFSGNYGDDKYISIRQIRFIRSKESSVKILQQPSQYILDPGPRIGVEAQITLKCEAVGWPTPTYQWYRGDELLEGETNPQLKLELYCPTVGSRMYRCLKCKMVSPTLPLNAFHVKCGNCGYYLVFKEAEEFNKQLNDVHAQEEDLNKTKTGLLSSKVQMESFNNPKYKNILLDLEERIELIENKLGVLREARYYAKKKTEISNKYSSEGVYYCIVQNIRGGGLKIKRRSIPAVVVVERPEPFVADVQPFYQPRQQIRRKKWNIYASVLGTFREGRVEGLCCIRYNDNSFFEGPYIVESAVDWNGQTNDGYRAPDHYGIYRLPDGRIFEGFNVDNHFDVNNLQSFYRLTFPNGEIYEGDFCDEQFHGIGMMTFVDGSVYEGQWHRGMRFGHGHFRSSEGWTYEGFFDKNRRHRSGLIDWPDGACYMGDWFYDKIQGHGCYITPLRDVYRGQLVDGRFHGHGELVYADGSTYVGEFKEGLRHGKGVFIEREGGEYFGHFENDLRHGEHVVKVIIPIEEVGQDNYEIRIGVYEHGKLVTWKSKFSNPIATKQFVALFKQNREMFDSVYSMILAKNLPNLPEGIDGNDPGVKAITFKIRTEAGMLVGQQALNDAKAQLEALFNPLAEKTQLVDKLKKEIEVLSMSIIALEKESSEAFAQFSNLMSKFEKDTAKIEQHWLDEPTQVRANFLKACQKLDTLSVDDYFSFRNHRVVPVFVKKTLDAICYLLGLSTEWNKQQMIIADSITNGRNGDEEALRLDYKCKLSYLMKEYRVYDHVQIKEKDNLAKILADVRFRSDSYYVESTGPAGPVLVEWVKTNYAYIRAAEKMYGILDAAEEKRIAAFRIKATHTKKKEEVFETTNKLEVVRKQLSTAQLELEDTQLAVLKANNLLQFIAGRYGVNQSFGKQDYYKLLEKKIEEKKDRFTIEVCLRDLVDKVIERNDAEQQKALLQAMATGKQYDPPVLKQQSIIDWIRDEVLSQQAAIVDGGRTLGYFVEPQSTDVTLSYTAQLVSLIVDMTTSKLNDAFNDLASAKSWISRKGKRISSRFLFIFAWKIWKEEAIAHRNRIAMQMWENIFGDPFTCAVMAIEARVSNRMSSVAKFQGSIWAEFHKADIAAAEQFLADDFAKDFESVEDIAQYVIDIENDTSDAVTPSQRARAICWADLHRDEMRAARDRYDVQFSEAFEEHFGKESSLVCFKLLNGLGVEEELEWLDYAPHWKDFHAEEYETAAEATINELSKDFIDAYPLNTYLEAAKLIENDALSRYIVDDEIRTQFAANPKHLINAYCWGVKHQGLLKKGKEMMLVENRKTFCRMWDDLSLQTDHFAKGTALHVVLDENGHDRFLGYRNRLSNKFAWVHGFLQLRLEVLAEDLRKLDLVDPINKVLHRVRPSEQEQVAHMAEDEFLHRKRKLESEYNDFVAKLSAWNTYFGWSSERANEKSK